MCDPAPATGASTVRLVVRPRVVARGLGAVILVLLGLNATAVMVVDDVGAAAVDHPYGRSNWPGRRSRSWSSLGTCGTG